MKKLATDGHKPLRTAFAETVVLVPIAGGNTAVARLSQDEGGAMIPTGDGNFNWVFYQPGP